MDKKFIIIGVLILLALVVISGCSQKPAADKNIKSEADVKKTLENATSDIQGLSEKLNDLDKVFN